MSSFLHVWHLSYQKVFIVPSKRWKLFFFKYGFLGKTFLGPPFWYPVRPIKKKKFSSHLRRIILYKYRPSKILCIISSYTVCNLCYMPRNVLFWNTAKFPRSSWHLADYNIVKFRDRSYIYITKFCEDGICSISWFPSILGRISWLFEHPSHCMWKLYITDTILRIFMSSPYIAGCPDGGERVQVQGDAPPHRLLWAGGGECRSSETGVSVSQYLKGLCHEIDLKKFHENGKCTLDRSRPKKKKEHFFIFFQRLLQILYQKIEIPSGKYEAYADSLCLSAFFFNHN